MRPTLFSFFTKYILQVRKQNLVLLFSAIALFLKTYGKLKQQAIVATICNPKSEDPKKVSDLFYFTFISSVFVISVPIFELLGWSLETTITKGVHDNSYAQFIQYKFNNWNEYLSADLYSVIHRRAMAVAKFYKIAFYECFDNFIYIISGVLSLVLEHGMQRHISTAIVYMLVVPVFVNGLSTCRNWIERQSNEAYDKGEKALKDIFLNYEMIHTYNTFDQEILNYRLAMVDAKFWFICYWLSNNVLSVFHTFSPTLLIVLMFGQIDFAVLDAKDIFLQMTSFKSISKRLNVLTESTKKMFESTENALNCKLDLLNDKSANCQVIRKTDFTSKISFQKMSKFYNENLVFQNINFDILKGEKIAITGANGSGKSSFVKSLVGLEPFSGVVTLDDLPVTDICDADFRRLMTFVSQDCSIFDATIYENITCFDTKISPETVFNTVYEYGMSADFKTMGYDTVLLDDGSNISAAQKRKICFIRAILRDSPIYIFDEVTSGMDKDYEFYLVETIISKLKNKTLIMIVHNLDLLPKFDKVVFFDNHTTVGSMPFKNLILENDSFLTYANMGNKFFS